jgi:transposase
MPRTARRSTHPPALQVIIAAALRGDVTEEQVREVHQMGPEATSALVMALTQAMCRMRPSAISPSTPSGAVPTHLKPQVKPARRKKKPGAKPGHKGAARKPAPRIDATEEHRLPRCPECDGELQRCNRTRSRIIEDIPVDIQPKVTEHLIHRDYCPHCHRHVEPVVPDAMPNATIGHNVVMLSLSFHYGLGLTLSSVQQILNGVLNFTISAGGLIGAWQRTAEMFMPWYEQIQGELLKSSRLHADESGWRVGGQNHWLWCFCNPTGCLYLIDQSRGHSALLRFFKEAFDGTLITDFLRVYYNVESDDRQYCIPHLLREMDTVNERNHSPPWQAFYAKLRRLIGDGLRLRRRPDYDPKKYDRRIQLINRRLNELADDAGLNQVYDDPDAIRLGKRISMYRDHLFTFLDKPEIPHDNNHAERMLRPAVIMRKNSQQNRSDRGAQTQAVLMSIYRTLKLRGHDPVKTMTAAARQWVQTGQLPPMPGPVVAEG